MRIKREHLEFPAEEMGTVSQELVMLDVVDEKGRTARAFVTAKAARGGIRFELEVKKHDGSKVVGATASLKNFGRFA